MDATSVLPPVMGMKVVINGGSKVLESATLPIQWFFDESAAAKRPQWILIVCQSIDPDEPNTVEYWSGTRHIYHVTDRIGFVQLHRAGPYRILVTATTENPRSKLVRDGRESYEHGIRWPNYHDNFDPDACAAYATGEFEIPDGMFAKRSETWLGKLLWQWINRWHETVPRDQCQYRARAMLAFTAQPVIVGIAYLLRYAFALVMTVYLLLARTLAVYFGYRPVNLVLGLKGLWDYDTEIRYLEWKVKAYKYNSYRVWRRPEGRWSSKQDVKMPFTPFVATLVVGGLWGLYKLYVYLPSGTIMRILQNLGIGILVAAAFITVIIVVGKLLSSKRVSGWIDRLVASIRQSKITAQEEIQIKRQAEADSYVGWLKTEMSVTHAPPRVSLEHLPKPFKNRAVHEIRTKFWAAKLAVCKPFAR